jgi:copper chaperone CopZ
MTDHTEVSELKIEGMHCGGCVSRVKKALEKVPGLTIDDVKIGLARVRLGAVPKDDVARALEQAGYPLSYAGEG